MTIKIPLTDNGTYYDPSRLEKVEVPFTEQDIEVYDRIGWKHYREEDFFRIIFPSLGESCGFNSLKNVVIPIKGMNYEVEWQEDYNFKPYDPTGKVLLLTPTEKPASASNGTERSWYRFFGQPRFVQNPMYVLDLLGNPCYHFLTIENGWGDAGNFNIQIGFDEQDIPNFAYFEASCC
jgi:hypothetical protein